jgi:parallel beta-helix repeat protein
MGFVRFAGCLAMTLGLFAAVSQSAQASPLTLFVNGASGADTGTCASSTTPCASISYALSQAGAGATVYVANGVYPEQLTITQRVSIIGASTAHTIIRPMSVPLTDSDTDSATPQRYIVDVAPNTTGVTIKHLTIDGSAASSTFTSCADNFVGVYFHDASGHLGGVRVTGIELPTSLRSCKDGVGVYVDSDPGNSSTVFLLYMQISAYQQNGIACDDPGTTCTIATSRITGNGPSSLVSQNGVQVFGASASINNIRILNNTNSAGGAGKQAMGLRLLNAATVTVKDSLIKGNDVDIYAGEVPADGLVPPRTGPWTISNNRTMVATDHVSGGESGYGDGIAIDSTSNAVYVTGNTARGNAESGIALYGADHVQVLTNTVTLNLDGIYVGGPGTAVGASSSDLVGYNVAMINHRDGILAGARTTESGNTFTGNASRFNVADQAVDLSTGSGTAGTANSWGMNHCRGGPTGSPAKIC